MSNTTLRTYGFTTVLVMAVTLIFTISARGDSCQTVTFADGYIVDRTGNTDEVRTGLIGSYLQVQIGEYTGQMPEDGTVSHEVPADATGAAICPDGSVTFALADPAPVPVVVDEIATPVVQTDEILTPFEAGFSLLPA